MLCHTAWPDPAALRGGGTTDRLEGGPDVPTIQQQFGFHEPVFGCVLDSKPSGHVFAADELIVPGFENELCMRLGSDLSGTVSLDDARAAIDVVYPSLEIIETRGPFTEQIALALADNAQQKTVILGAPAALPANLTDMTPRSSSTTSLSQPARAMPCSATRFIRWSGWRRNLLLSGAA